MPQLQGNIKKKHIPKYFTSGFKMDMLAKAMSEAQVAPEMSVFDDNDFR